MLHFPPLIQFHTNFLFGWDWLSHSSLCRLTRGDCFDFAADLTRLNGIGLGRVDGWLPAIISFVFLIVAYSSLPFLFSPLSFVCLTLPLSIWPTIDKTQSPTMLGALHGIGDDDGNRALWRVCVCSACGEEMGCGSRHCLSTFNFQMVLTRKNVFLDNTPSFCPLLSPICHLSRGSVQGLDCISGPECAAWAEGEGDETAWKADWDLRGGLGKSGVSLSVAVRV